MNLANLSKTISHALRHEPWIYELEIDSQGWVPTSDLIQALKETSSEWINIDVSTIQQIIDSTEKKRFEILDDKIRALYGHSVPEKLLYTPSIPPAILYHGTTIEIAEIIKKEGLKPMSRQYVHLSTDMNIANEVARRKGKNIVLLSINASDACSNGVKFYEGNNLVWLCDYMPVEYILD